MVRQGQKFCILDIESSFANQFRGAARGEKTDIMLDKTLGEVEQACFVINRQNG